MKTLIKMLNKANSFESLNKS